VTATHSVLGLSEGQLQHYQTTFKLSYHLNYLQVCQQFLRLRGLDVLEVGGALPASLVIDHLGCNSWTAVEAPAYDEELGAANQFHRNLRDQDHQQKHAASYKHLYLDIEAIHEEHYGQYDLIFSIACFEHIHRLPQALRVMHRCLKPGGRLFTMHSPIWSAFDGHHLPIGIPARFESSQSNQGQIFRAWEHLLLTRTQAFKVIRDRFDAEFAEEVIYYTYNSDHINRYFSEDYLMAFEASLYEIEHCHLTFHIQPPSEIEAALKQRHPGYTQFSNNGIFALLQKPESPLNLQTVF
jgi:SAM-dependent methyltransferase